MYSVRMIWIMGFILVVLVFILVMMGYLLLGSPRVAPKVDKDKELEREWMSEMVGMMREAKEEQEKMRLWREMEEREKEKMEAGLRSIKKRAEGIMSSNQPERPIKGTREYVPYGLNERDRAILDEFYNGD